MLIEEVGHQELGELTPALHELYRECFSEPPWNESATQLAAFPGVLARALAQPGLHGLVAWEGTRLIGVLYGRGAPEEPPSDDFHRSLAGQISAGLYRELLAPAVVVNELMVHPRSRGRGVGRALLDRFVAGHPTAWLCTHPEAPARRLYESAGWLARAEFVNYLGDPRVLYTVDPRAAANRLATSDQLTSDHSFST